jgi:hypothetical protein
LALRVTGDVNVVDLVNPQIGRVRHHGEIRAVELVPHVDLLGDPAEQLRQRLVDRIQRDRAGDAGMNVDIHLRVTREGEQQFAHIHVVDDDAVGFGLRRRLRARRHRQGLDGRRNGRSRRGRLLAQMPARGRLHRLEAAAEHGTQPEH